MKSENNWTNKTGNYVLKQPLKYAGNSLSSIVCELVHYASNIVRRQIEELESNPLVTRWFVPPQAEGMGIAYTSSLDQKEHEYFPDFVCGYNHRIQVIENKANTNIEARYNVEPLIDDIKAKIAEGQSITKIRQSLTEQDQRAIAIRDKRIAGEKLAMVKGCVYHLTYHFPNKAADPTTYHELYLATRDKILACDFTSQNDILEYVRTIPTFHKMSKQLLSHHINKKMIQMRYVSKTEYDYCFAEALSVAADAKREAEAAALQAKLAADAKIAAARRPPWNAKPLACSGLLTPHTVKPQRPPRRSHARRRHEPTR